MGTPQPSDALTAASGVSSSPLSAYSEAPNTPVSSAGLAQPPLAAAVAAAAYFSRTVSRTCSAVAGMAIVAVCGAPAAQPQPSACGSPQHSVLSEGSQQVCWAAGAQHWFAN